MEAITVTTEHGHTLPVRFERFIDTLGGECIQTNYHPTCTKCNCVTAALAEAAESELGHPRKGSRSLGSILRSENPMGLVAVIVW